MKLTPLILAQPQKTLYPKELPYRSSHLSCVKGFCETVIHRFQGRHKCYVHPKSKFIYQATGSHGNWVWGWRLGKLNEEYVEDPETLMPEVLQKLAEIEADLRSAVSYIEAKRAGIVEDIRNAVKEGLDGKV